MISRAARVAVRQRGRQRLGLLERDVRRQRRHLRVGDRLQHHRPVGGERLLPGAGELLGVVDADAAQADQLGVAGVGEVGQLLGGLVARVALHRALLPRDLVEIVVVQHEHDQPRVAPALASTWRS